MKPFAISGHVLSCGIVVAANIENHFELVGNRLRVSYRFRRGCGGYIQYRDQSCHAKCDGWGGRYVHQGQIPGGFGQPLDLDDLTDITLDDDELRGSIELEVSPPRIVPFQALLFSIPIGGWFRKNHAGGHT